MPTPDVVKPPPGHPRFPLLDALRAVAALAVLASHVGALTGVQGHWYGTLFTQGIAGVTIFFVLSGFLLYRPFLASELDGAPGVRNSDYARRRALRILPAYWVALTIIGLWLNLPGTFGHDSWRYYGLLQVYSTHTLFGGLSAAWTLCIEITFYLVLPFYAVGVARLGRGRSRESRLRADLLVLAVLAAVSLVVRYYTVHDSVLWLYATLVPYFGWFAVGMAMAVVSVGPVAPRAVAAVGRHPARCWLVAAAAYVLLSYLLRGPLRGQLFFSTGQWMAQHLLSAVVAAALIAPAVFGDRLGGWSRRLLAWPSLAYLGLVSYGIYLWQGGWVEQVARWAAGWSLPARLLFPAELLIVLLASVACAAISYHFLERPLMRFKYRRRNDAPPPTAREAAAVPASGG